MSTGLRHSLLAEVRAGRHDLVIATSRPRGRTLSAVPPAGEEFVLVAAPEWAERIGDRPAAEGTGVLHTVPLVTYAEDLPISTAYLVHRAGTPALRTSPGYAPVSRGRAPPGDAGSGRYSNREMSPAPRRTISGSPPEKSMTVVGSVPQSPESSTASTAWSSLSLISHP